MKKWSVDFAVSGTGYAEVEAETEEEARKKAKDGDFSKEPEINEWDINRDGWRGGFIDILAQK